MDWISWLTNIVNGLSESEQALYDQLLPIFKTISEDATVESRLGIVVANEDRLNTFAAKKGFNPIELQELHNSLWRPDPELNMPIVDTDSIIKSQSYWDGSTDVIWSIEN